MTDTEIIRSYKGAGTRKKHQITVLAQLNDCTRYEIITRLTAAGVEITDGQYIKQCEKTQDKERAELRAADEEAYAAAAARKEGKKMPEKVNKEDAVQQSQRMEEKTEKAAGKKKKAKTDVMPQCVYDALIARLDVLEGEMRNITNRKKELEEALTEKENEYKELCRFMGIGAFD